MRQSHIFKDVLSIIFRVTNVFNIIWDVDNNIIELYNWYVMKFIGGNFILCDSYQTWCKAAFTSMNSDGMLHCKMVK